MSNRDDHYMGALLEDIQDRLKLIQEALEPLKDVPADIKEIKADLAELKDWRGIAELVIKDHSKTLNSHQRRILKLETA